MAAYDVNVCIEGESGAGKEVIGVIPVHGLSRRSMGPFITINCGAIPETLIESELFGHEKGAFTGALERRLGNLNWTNHGTLFLDEVAEVVPDDVRHGLAVITDGQHPREVVMYGTGEHASDYDPQESYGTVEGTKDRPEDGAKTGNVQQLDQKHLGRLIST